MRRQTGFATALGALMTAALGATACSDGKDEESTGARALALVDPLTVSDTASTTFTATDLAARLTTETALGRLSRDAVLLPSPDTSKLARLSSGIDSCVAARIAELPVSVTGDSLRVEYDLDLTALCDEAPKPKETVTEIANAARGRLVVSCVGGRFASLAGKKLSEVRSAGLCADTDLAYFALDMRVSARKVATTTTTAGTLTTTTTRVQVEESSLVWSRPDGSACSLERDPADDKKSTVGDCRLALVEKTFDGLPENEAKAPSEALAPRVVALQADFGKLGYDTSATYFRDGSTSFWLNGWAGTLTYTNGNAPPRWEATKDGATATGQLGQSTPTTGGLRSKGS